MNMAYKWGVILTTYDTWEPILQAIPKKCLFEKPKSLDMDPSYVSLKFVFYNICNYRRIHGTRTYIYRSMIFVDFYGYHNLEVKHPFISDPSFLMLFICRYTALKDAGTHVCHQYKKLRRNSGHPASLQHTNSTTPRCKTLQTRIRARRSPFSTYTAYTHIWDPCIVYLPTFTIKIKVVNVGKKKTIPLIY